MARFVVPVRAAGGLQPAWRDDTLVRQLTRPGPDPECHEIRGHLPRREAKGTATTRKVGPIVDAAQGEAYCSPSRAARPLLCSRRRKTASWDSYQPDLAPDPGLTREIREPPPRREAKGTARRERLVWQIALPRWPTAVLRTARLVHCSQRGGDDILVRQTDPTQPQTRD